MRSKKIAVYLCMGLLLATAGCGSSNVDSDLPTGGTIIFKDLIDMNEEESNSTQSQTDYVQPQSDQLQSARPQSDSRQSQADNAQVQANSELDGKIESIDENSVVINKTFILSEDTAVSYAVSFGDSGKVLVDVFFSEETEFEVWTVKNGGVNGDADIEKRQGAFSDLEQGGNINMTGYYDGDDFHANHVILYHFV